MRRRYYYKTSIGGFHYIFTSLLLAIGLTLPAASFQQQGFGFYIQKTGNILTMPCFICLGHAAFCLPIVLAAIGFLKLWRMHYISRARWIIRLVFSLPLLAVVLTGMSLLIKNEPSWGGATGDFYFRYYHLLTAGILPSFFGTAFALCLVAVLWGLNPWKGIVYLLRKFFKITVVSWKFTTKSFLSRNRSSKKQTTKVGALAAANKQVEGNWQPPLSGNWICSSPVSDNSQIIDQPLESDDSGEALFMPLPPPDNDNPIPIEILPEHTLVIPSAEHFREEMDRIQQQIVTVVKRVSKIDILPVESQLCLSHMLLQFRPVGNKNGSVSKISGALTDIGLETGRSPVCLKLDEAINIELPLHDDERGFVPIKPLLQECTASLSRCEPDVSYLLGRRPDGTPLELSIKKARNLLVAGATGGGKTNFLHTVIMSIIFRYSPSTVRLALVDFKRFEFSRYRWMRHLWQEVVTTREGFYRLIDNLTAELQRRKQIKIEDEEATFPAIITIVDEFAGYNDEKLTRLIAEIRAVNMHVILATQHPTAENISTSIKANLVSSIAFKVRDSSASHLVVGNGDAKNLLQDGDCIVQTPTELCRIQAGWVRKDGDESDRKALKRYIKGERGCLGEKR